MRGGGQRQVKRKNRTLQEVEGGTNISKKGNARRIV